MFIYLGATNEPPLPRRKKCPELAYRTNEFILRDGDNYKNDLTATAPSRARVSITHKIS